MIKYNVIYITHLKNGCYISTTTEKNLSLDEAINFATNMNKHLWKFHQDKDKHSIYTVREIL